MHPILFKFGPLTIYSYGLMVALGFVTATFLASRQAPRFNIPPDNITTFSLIVLVSGIVGARGFYILLNLKEYISHPLEALMVTHGGLVFYGGAIAAFLSSLIYINRAKLPLWDTADLISPYIALGHSIGRIGCFLNGCCFGKGGHPAQIYSSFSLLLLYIFLRSFYPQRRQFKGQVFCLYMILYPAGRFFIEFLRGDNPPFLYNLTFSQVVSLIVLSLAALGYFKRWSRTR